MYLGSECLRRVVVLQLFQVAISHATVVFCSLSGKMIGDMTLIFLNADDFKTAWYVCHSCPLTDLDLCCPMH